MELKNLTNLVKKNAVVVACTLAPFGACASSQTTHQLADARAAYDDAENSSAPTRNPSELADARRALDRAERAHDENPGSDREATLAARAERKARVAMRHADGRGAYPAESREDRAAREERRADLAKAEAEQAKVDRERVREGADHTVTAAERKRSAAALQNLTQVANVKEEPRGIVITMSGSLLFPSGEEELSPIARRNLDQVADAIQSQPVGTDVTVEGHTDNTGSDTQNMQLSTHRAQAVADHLIQRGVPSDHVRVIGYGEKQAIASNDTAEGRASNRRVEIVVNSNRH